MKLTKKLINHARLVVTPTYLSNGHWLVRRSLLSVSDNALVASSALACDKLGASAVSEYAEEMIAKVIPAPDKCKAFTFTGIYLNGHYNDQALYRSADGEWMGLDRAYVLGVDCPEIVNAKDGTSAAYWADSEGEVLGVIMPLEIKGHPALSLLGKVTVAA